MISTTTGRNLRLASLHSALRALAILACLWAAVTLLTDPPQAISFASLPVFAIWLGVSTILVITTVVLLVMVSPHASYQYLATTLVGGLGGLVTFLLGCFTGGFSGVTLGGALVTILATLCTCWRTRHRHFYPRLPLEALVQIPYAQAEMWAASLRLTMETRLAYVATDILIAALVALFVLKGMLTDSPLVTLPAVLVLGFSAGATLATIERRRRDYSDQWLDEQGNWHSSIHSADQPVKRMGDVYPELRAEAERQKREYENRPL